MRGLIRRIVLRLGVRPHPRDEDLVPMWTAEDEISLARRVVAAQEKK